jgi:transcriptional regulator with XRE-family HTH domain
MRFDGTKLRQLRTLYKLTQDRLATLAKVEQYEISRLESGARVDAIGAKVVRIVDALNYVEAEAAESEGREAVPLFPCDLYDHRHEPEEYDGWKVG